MRLADYVAKFIADKGITDVFSVTGGGAMHLNDALGHHERLHVTYCHHEQACAMAAECYARLHNHIALVCVTSGPGGTNALTGVLGGWIDSTPMMIVSGQVRYDTTSRYALAYTGSPLRAMGDQEYDITRAASAMTKYAVMVEDAKDIRKILERAHYLAVSGRPGPVWVDIPVDIQGSLIEPDQLEAYSPSQDMLQLPGPVSPETIKAVTERLQRARRPVFYAGNGIRLSGGYSLFRKLIERLGIPVVTYWNAIDLIEDDHPLYAGRGGGLGDRAGNWAVQNADLILAVGTRLSIRQVGYQWKSWARAAQVIMVDIDKAELKKPTLHVDMPIWADAGDFLEALAEEAGTLQMEVSAWLQTCQNWRQKYPVAGQEKWNHPEEACNVYAFIHSLSSALPDGSITAASNGSCCVAGHQAYVIGKDSRFLINNGAASMGYGLPAAVGACLASGRQTTICLEGDGSIMMNLQELQTIITNDLPIKIFLINNQGYHSIRITQRNIFPEKKPVGIGPESGDLSFPEFRKIAEAFGYRYFRIGCQKELPAVLDAALKASGAVFCEVITDTGQDWEPRSQARRMPDGSLTSSPLEDLAPFLPREELEAQMKIPLVKS